MREIGHLLDMSETLEKRVATLEKQFSELSAIVLGLRRRNKDWRSTCGTFKDDEMTREAERLGREYRAEQTFDKEIAGS